MLGKFSAIIHKENNFCLWIAHAISEDSDQTVGSGKILIKLHE